MPGSVPATSQLDWLSSTTAMIVLFWSRATRDLLKSFGWGIAALHRLMQRRSCHPRRPPHSVYQYRVTPPRFREGVISAPLDSHQPKGSTNENRHHGNAEGSCDLRPVSDLHDGIGIQPTLRSGRDAT